MYSPKKQTYSSKKNQPGNQTKRKNQSGNQTKRKNIKLQTKTCVLVQPNERKQINTLANVENNVTNEIHTSLFAYPTYSRPKIKNKKNVKAKAINKSHYDYDLAYKYSDLADKLEFKKGDRCHLEFPLAITNHAKQRRQERVCKNGEKIYNVVHNDVIVTSFPISKVVNTKMLKHLDNKMKAYRYRFLER